MEGGKTFLSSYARTLSNGPLRFHTDRTDVVSLLLEIANELAFEMTLESGDIQFLNSHVTYHGRRAFQDSDESGRARILMRLWLSMPNSRPLPHGHEILWGSVEAGARRGGIGQVPAV